MQRNRITQLLNDDALTRSVARYKVSSLEQRLYAAETDANHNVTSIEDVFGAVKEDFVYDPYRNSTVLTSAWASTSDGYSWTVRSQGEREDTTTNTIDSRNRVYALGTGRWLQADNIGGYVDGANRYQFVRSNPNVGLDPFGLADKPINNSENIGTIEKASTTSAQAILKRRQPTDKKQIGVTASAKSIIFKEGTAALYAGITASGTIACSKDTKDPKYEGYLVTLSVEFLLEAELHKDEKTSELTLSYKNDVDGGTVTRPEKPAWSGSLYLGIEQDASFLWVNEQAKVFLELPLNKPWNSTEFKNDFHTKFKIWFDKHAKVGFQVKAEAKVTLTYQFDVPKTL